jgi:hypothetical protein
MKNRQFFTHNSQITHEHILFNVLKQYKVKDKCQKLKV